MNRLKILFFHVVVEKNGKVDILAYVYRKIVGGHDKKDHHTQQQQYQHCTDAGGNELHIEKATRLLTHNFLFFSEYINHGTAPVFLGQ